MSVVELKSCRQFYLTFPDYQKCYTLCSQLSWSHLRQIMRLDTERERVYYVEQARMGGGERQMHIKTETQDFYIDLVFNHFILKCFVLIDLKNGVLKHKDIAQMYMCVRIFHDTGKADDDTPTVGIANSYSCCPSKMNLLRNSRIETHLASGLRRAMMVREKEKALCALDDVEIVFELAMQCLQLDELGLQNDNETSQEKCAT